MQSFVDIMHLACEPRSDLIPLEKVQRCLMVAEQARRVGDTAAMVAAYRELGQLYALSEFTARSSIYFFDRALGEWQAITRGNMEEKGICSKGDSSVHLQV